MSGKFVSGAKTGAWLWLILAAWTFALPQTAAAGIYKWKDETGRVHFTDSLQKIPEKYRKGTKVKKMKMRPLPAPPVKPMPQANEGQGDASGSADSQNAPGAAASEGDAKMMQETIAFLNQDIERYKKYEDYVPQRRSALMLRNEIVGALPAKEALLEKLKTSESASLKAAQAFLKASIAKDLEAKKQEYPKRLVFIGERTRINAEKIQKAALIEQLQSEMKTAAAAGPAAAPPVAPGPDTNSDPVPAPASSPIPASAPPEPEGSQSKSGY